MGQPTDAQLIIAAREGDQAAFSELLARYRGALFGVCFHRLGNFEEARDAAQEAGLKALANLAKLQKPAAFAHWLYRIADGTALDFVRRRKGEVPLEEAAALAAPSQPEPSDLAQQVLAALGVLDEASRLALILHYVGGYSHAEVAAFLGTTPGAIKTRLSRARQKLRQEVIGMVEVTLKREANGVLTGIARHPSGKANAALGWNGPDTDTPAGEQRVRELAEALVWLDPDLRREPGWQENFVAAQARWLDHFLTELLHDKADRLELALVETEEKQPLHIRTFAGDEPLTHAVFARHDWPAFREGLLARAGLSTDVPAQQSGEIVFGGEHLSVEFTPNRIVIKRTRAS